MAFAIWTFTKSSVRPVVYVSGHIFQVHTITEQRVGMAKGAGAKRGGAARGPDQVRAEFQQSKFQLPRESLGGVLEAREAAERKSHVQDELRQPEATAASDISRGV